MADTEEVDIKKYCQKVMKAVASATQNANVLPKLGENYELYSSFPAFAEFMNVERERVLELLSKMLRHSGYKARFSSAGDPEESMDNLIFANDAILERIGNSLDEAAGIRKKEETVSANLGAPKAPSWIVKPDAAGPSSKTGFKMPLRPTGRHIMSPKNIPKPQLQFKNAIDNENTPFRVKLKEKHNASKPWTGNLEVIDVESDGRSTAWPTDVAEISNPYKYELDHLKPTERQLHVSEIVEPKPLQETSLLMINTREQVVHLCGILLKQAEFAVDLEHNDYRSFLGLTCLIQISTREQDFIIDPFPIWKDMHLLNDPFTNPSIVKRDFGVYVVNMFDTGQAMRVLTMPRRSLAFLVLKMCDVTLAKQYQRADWRIRPLPEDHLEYARCDTHYLLYCYDRLRQDLLKRSGSRCYQKPMFTSDLYLAHFGRNCRPLNNRQLEALKSLFAWRDKTARTEDESLAFVLPDHMMLQIAQVLPKEAQGILACCNPIPLFVKQELNELHRLIMHAREQTLQIKDVPQYSESMVLHKRDSTAWIRRPHDFSHALETEEIQPLAERIAATGQPLEVQNNENDSAVIFLFESKSKCQDESLAERWISPYEQYLLAKEESAKHNEKKRKLQEAKEAEAKKKRYTHKDPSTGVGSSDGQVSNPVVAVPPEAKAEAEINRVIKKKGKKRKGPKADVGTATRDVSPFDYSQFHKEMFAESSAAARKDVFDPGRSLRPRGLGNNKPGKKSKKKATRPFGRLGAKTTSFGRKK